MTIFEEIIEALSDREADFQAALEAGFHVEDRLANIRSLLQRLRDITAFTEAAQAIGQAIPWREHIH
jgi:hypothetical protein